MPETDDTLKRVEVAKSVQRREAIAEWENVWEKFKVEEMRALFDKLDKEQLKDDLIKKKFIEPTNPYTDNLYNAYVRSIYSNLSAFRHSYGALLDDEKGRRLTMLWSGLREHMRQLHIPVDIEEVEHRPKWQSPMRREIERDFPRLGSLIRFVERRVKNVAKVIRW